MVCVSGLGIKLLLLGFKKGSIRLLYEVSFIHVSYTHKASVYECKGRVSSTAATTGSPRVLQASPPGIYPESPIPLN